MNEPILYLQSLPLQAYQNLAFPIFIKNQNSEYLWANHFFIKKSAGFKSVNDIYKKQDHDFSWIDYADELRLNDKLLLQTEQTITARERILRHDGTYVDAVSKKCPLFNNNQKLVGLLGFTIALPKAIDTLSLSRREYAVVLLLTEGYSYKEIAKKLGVSPRTIETHLIHAKQKMNVTTRAELIAKFTRSHP